MNNFKITRQMKISIDHIINGDKIVVSIEGRGDYIVTCQYVDVNEAIFMFDTCIERVNINHIHNICSFEAGYIGNIFDYYIKRTLKPVYFGKTSYEIEYRIPTIEHLFSKKKVDSIDPFYKYEGIHFDNIDKPIKRKRRYRGEDSWYFLSTNSKMIDKYYIVNSEGKLGTSVNPNAEVGICPIIVMKK